MIILSFAVTAMYALLGAPPPVPFLPVTQLDTDSPRSGIGSSRDSSQERKQGRKQNKSRLSITHKTQPSPVRKRSQESDLVYKTKAMGPKGWNPIVKGKGSLDSPVQERIKSHSCPQMTASTSSRRQEDSLDPGDQEMKSGKTPRKNAKELASKSSSSSSLNCRRLHSSTGTTSLVRTSALERSRLAYEKKVRQLSARAHNSTATKDYWTPKRPYEKGSKATPKKESLRTPRKARNTSTSSESPGGATSIDEPSRLKLKLNCFSRLLGRSFSASCTVPAEVPKQKTPTRTTTPKQWRSLGVVRSHSLGDTPATPVARRGHLQMKLETQKTSRSPVKATAGTDNPRTGSSVKKSVASSQSGVVSTCYHICLYYAISFLVFVSIQMYEAYFGGNLFQLLANSRRYC